MLKVKICGNTDAEQITLCALAGADAIGLVVEYPEEVPWNLTREVAQPLIMMIPPFISRVVVTGGNPDRVCAIAEYLSPHVLQLHTDNPVHEVAQIVKRLTGQGISVIAALRIDARTGQACGNVADPVEAALALQDAGIHALLLDTKNETMPAGTGMPVSWEMARQVCDALSIPLILAGGLTPENVRLAVETVHPFAVDVITGVEVRRKVKDPHLVHTFIQQAKLSAR